MQTRVKVDSGEAALELPSPEVLNYLAEKGG